MATSYTSLLGLALPVTGELSGTWGDTVNTSITSLLDTSVAGTTNVSTDADVTLTTTTGAANTARQAILLFSGARTVLRTVTAPAQSKIYTVINATTGGFAVKLVGAGPTTGLTIPNGASATVAWNGSDFIEVGTASIGNLTVNGTLTVTGATSLQSTLAVTGAITNTAGTANGVTYLNGSKVVTSGSAIQFDGTRLLVGSTSDSSGGGYFGAIQARGSYPAVVISGTEASAKTWQVGENTGALTFYNTTDSELMRLTSTGLGIGTSSPSAKLHVSGAGLFAGATSNSLGVTSTSGSALINLNTTGTGGRQFYIYASDNTNAVSGGKLVFEDATSGNQLIYAGASGNLGLGVTPSAWNTYKALEIGRVGNYFAGYSGGTELTFGANAYYSTGWKYAITGALATRYMTDNSGGHYWYNAASGTAGNAITFTQAMTLDASGNFGLGSTSPSSFSGSIKAVIGTAATSTTSAGLTLYTGTATYGGLYFADGTIGDQLYRGAVEYNHSSDALLLYSAGAERARINSSGNLGIGTTSPLAKLEVYNSSVTAAFVPNTASTWSVAQVRNNGTVTAGNAVGIAFVGRTDVQPAGIAAINSTTGGGATSLAFMYVTGNTTTEGARIDSSGRLLVGTTSTVASGDEIAGFIGTAGISAKCTGGATRFAGSFWNDATAGDNVFLRFYSDGGTERGSITYNRAGGLTVYNTTSDYRAKDIYGPVTGSGALIDSTPVYMGKMKGATQERPMFIAHETPAYAHTGVKDAVDADGNPVYQQMDASALIPVMWAEIQSLRKRLADAGI